MGNERTPKEKEEDSVWERIKRQNPGIPADDNGDDDYIPEPASPTKH